MFEPRVIILQEILQAILFWCHKTSKRRVAKSAESNGLNLFSRKMGIVEQGLEQLFVTSSSSYFFNKTDLEQYLFNVVQKRTKN